MAMTYGPGLDPAYKFKLYRFAVWTGLIVALANTTSFFLMQQLFPPPEPLLSAQENYDFLMQRRDMILWGTILMGVVAPFYYFFSVVTSMQLRRIEGEFGLLSYLQVTTAVVAPTGWLYPLATLSTSVYRMDRAPELVQLMADNYWLTYVGVAAIFSINQIAVGLAVLGDRRKDPVFPRWFGYMNFFFALAFAPGIFVYAFQDGPLAWNGTFTLYIPSTAFPIWLGMMTWGLLRAVKQEEREEMAARAAAGVA